MLLAVSLVNRLSAVIPDGWVQRGGFEELNTFMEASQKIKCPLEAKTHWMNWQLDVNKLKQNVYHVWLFSWAWLSITGQDTWSKGENTKRHSVFHSLYLFSRIRLADRYAGFVSTENEGIKLHNQQIFPEDVLLYVNQGQKEALPVVLHMVNDLQSNWMKKKGELWRRGGG